MARTWYRRKRTVKEMTGATLALIIIMAALAVAGRLEQEPPQVETAELTREQRAEIIGTWYRELYPAYTLRQEHRP